MVFFYLIIFLINIIQIDSNLPSCQQTFGSNKYDLNQLSALTILGTQGIYKYAFTPCGLVPVTQCGQKSGPFDNGMTACQARVFGSDPPFFESSMGFLDGYQEGPNIEFKENIAGPGTGVVMTMRNARCSGMERLVIATFICDKSTSTPTTMEVKEDPPCTFNIIIKAAGACPLAPGNDTGNTGISGGAVFIIILLVVIVVYVIGTVSYNRFKENQRGVGLLPHPSFWLLLMGSFLSGCRFTLSFIRTGGKGSSGGNYNSV